MSYIENNRRKEILGLNPSFFIYNYFNNKDFSLKREGFNFLLLFDLAKYYTTVFFLFYFQECYLREV